MDNKKHPQPRPMEREVRSRHSGLGSATPYVHIRHPEFRPVHSGDVSETYQLDILGAMEPEEGVLSLDQPCDPFADTSCYLLDDFNRTAAGGSWSASGDGGAWATSVAYNALQTDADAFSLYTAVPKHVWSTLGRVAYAWTQAANTKCGGFYFQLDGWMEKEWWIKWTVPTHPTSMAGVNVGAWTFTAPTGLAGGIVGQAEGANVVVRSSAPTGLRQGTYVAHLPHNTATTFFIPGSLIPDAGGELWIGVQPNWYADYATGYTCSFRWPWMDGKGNSAKGYVTTAGATYAWQSYTVAADGWGSGLDDDTTGSWWEGNLPWEISASGGTYGFDGDSLYLTVAAGGQETLSATMLGTSEVSLDDAVDDAVGAPWTKMPGVAMKARFKVTTAGDTAEAGSRYLRFRWGSGRDIVSCEVKLGDTSYNEGLLLYGDDGYVDEVNYVEKAFSNTSWVWLLVDARNPEYLKAKIWDESSMFGGDEPAKWDIVVDIGDDSENPQRRDFFEIAMSAGNMTGANQTIQVDAVYFCGPGQDCEWVQEYMGQGDNETFQFYTSQPYKGESLWFYVDGMHVRAITLDAEQGKFRTPNSLPPATNANLVARYRVDGNPAGD